MSDMRYFGTYADFKTRNKNESALLVGADNIIGDRFTIEFRPQKGGNVAWIINKFGKDIGWLDAELSYQLEVFQARDWRISCLLSQVLYSDTPEPGNYWGRVAIVCNEKRYNDSIDRFLTLLSDSLAQGIRPEIALNKASIDTLITSQGDWISHTHLPLEKLPKGTVIIKDARKFSERVIEQGRARNVGCYVISWIFIIVMIIGIIAVVMAAFGLLPS